MAQVLSIHPATGHNRQAPQLVGRETELAQLHKALQRALGGERQFVFLTGEPGIGKTTVADTFLAQLSARPDLHIAQGQCVEHYGPGEAYLPLLEASNRLCRAPDGQRLIEMLKQHAPTWLLQLPALLDEAELEALQRRVQGATRERMLREMAEVTEVWTAQRGAVFVLEDLQWSDVSTLEWIGYLARRREPVRLLLIGTYRPAEILASDHPLKGVVQELKARGQCEELPLPALPEQAVGEYLAGRFTGVALPSELPGVIHRRTGGNPLFVVTVVEYLTQQAEVGKEDGQWLMPEDLQAIGSEVPDSLRQLIEKQLDNLAEKEQRLLEVASVAGVEFAVAEVAAGVKEELEEIEEQCERLARQGQFIQAQGVEEWPDGTLGERYSFLHAMYHNVLYDRISEARRIRLHQQIGKRKEGAYGEWVGEIAAELAIHFTVGRDSWRAVQYQQQAGETAIRRYANQEAITHLTQGLSILETLPHTPERARGELQLTLALSGPLSATQGYGAPEVGQTYTRARELCKQLEDPTQLFPVLRGLRLFHGTRAELQTARALGEELLSLADQVDEPAFLLEAHYALGETLFYLGEFRAARSHTQYVLTRSMPPQHQTHAIRYGQDPRVFCLAIAARTLWVLGYAEQALQMSQEASRLAHELGHAFSQAIALVWAAGIRQLCRDAPATQEWAQAAVTLSIEHEFPLWRGCGTILHEWALAAQHHEAVSVTAIQDELAALQATGATLARPYYLSLLAQVWHSQGQPEEGLALLDKALALAHRTGERWYAAELYRLKGELILNDERGTRNGERRKKTTTLPSVHHSSFSIHRFAEAETCFQQAIEIAQRQEAKAWELRATMSLSQLWHSQGKETEARQVLEEIYGWFTEGFETPDLQAAEGLLATFGSQLKRPASTTRRAQEASQASFPAVTAGLARPETSGLPSPRTEREEKAQRGTSPSRAGKAAGQPAVTSDTQAPQSDVLLPPAASAAAPVSEPLFRQEGEYWTLAFVGTVCRIKDSRGMHYLAQLLRHPQEEVHAVQLVTGGAALQEPDQPRLARRGSAAELAAPEERAQAGFTDVGEVLDPQARAAYKQRLNELQAELDEAQAFHDLGRADKLQEEIAFLTRELAQAVGLGGRGRKAGSVSERARVNVTRTIRAALKRIMESHPALGQHLTQTIKTGTYCSYTPDPRLPISWRV